MLRAWIDNIDTSLLGLLRGRQHAGIGSEVRVLRAKRKDLQVVIEYEWDAQIVQRDDLRYQFGMLFGAIHGNVTAIGMPDQRQMIVVGVGLQFLQFADHKQDIGFAALVNSDAANIGHTNLGYQRRIARQVLLDAGNQIAARREHVGEKRIFGIPDGIAVADDGDRKFPEAVVRINLVIEMLRHIDRDWSMTRRV